MRKDDGLYDCGQSALKTHIMNVTEEYEPLCELALAAIRKCVKD